MNLTSSNHILFDPVGVKPTGATYLYGQGGWNSRNSGSNRDQRNRIKFAESLDLLSVSPITFATYEELLGFLKDHAHKATGKKGRDNSRANKGLDLGHNERDVITDVGTVRALFEKQRYTFFDLCV